MLQMMMFRIVMLVSAGLLLSACQRAASVYPSDDSLRKGDVPRVPREFQEGNATIGQAKAWANARLMGNGSIVTEEHELIPGGKRALFISDSSCAGTGGNSYVVFDRTKSGLRYLGDIDFAVCAAAPPDASENPRLVTYWHNSASEGELTLWRLTKSGFTALKSATIHPGDEGIDQDNRTFDAFFGSSPIADALVDATFGRFAITSN
ncbi:MAG TPA: hypothetical protein VHX86_19135 [Tepidisphaeraceae bacterium]|jgi:hypothetical protein|nr:hypothetical protein [Tepidisphaeraceae bacterium]